MKQIGDQITLICKVSVDYFKARNMPITGKIISHDPNNKQGKIIRPWLIEFDDGRKSWRSTDEIRKVIV